VRIYFRRKVGQRRIRLRETPGTEAFDKEYQRAFRGETKQPAAASKRVAPASLRWLCQQYYASAEFQELAESTQTVRRGVLNGICDRRIEDECVGDWPYAEIEPRDVRRLRDEKKAFPDAANNLVKTLRQLFAWACLGDVGLAETNPARDVGRLKPHNPDGIRAWTEADALRYEARHPIGTKARLAFDLLIYTGVRRSDVVKLGRKWSPGSPRHCRTARPSRCKSSASARRRAATKPSKHTNCRSCRRCAKALMRQTRSWCTS
jgi:integrase